MAQARTVDVTRLIDERGITRYHIWLVGFAFRPSGRRWYRW